VSSAAQNATAHAVARKQARALYRVARANGMRALSMSGGATACRCTGNPSDSCGRQCDEQTRLHSIRMLSTLSSRPVRYSTSRMCLKSQNHKITAITASGAERARRTSATAAPMRVCRTGTPFVRPSVRRQRGRQPCGCRLAVPAVYRQSGRCALVPARGTAGCRTRVQQRVWRTDAPRAVQRKERRLEPLAEHHVVHVRLAVLGEARHRCSESLTTGRVDPNPCVRCRMRHERLCC
jgi:hypothetical protein